MNEFTFSGELVRIKVTEIGAGLTVRGRSQREGQNPQICEFYSNMPIDLWKKFEDKVKLYDVVTVVGHFEMWIKDRSNTGRDNNGKPKFMQKTIADSIILK